jgi:GMP synthase-like glutamine amidotransferase
MIVLIDNTEDSKEFYTKFVAFLTKSKITFKSVRTVSELINIPPLAVQGFILSGSTVHVPEIDENRRLMNTYAIHSGLPVLGICFGAQFIYQYFKGRLTRLPHMFCETNNVTCIEDPFMAYMKPEFQAKFCAEYMTTNTPKVLMPLCTSTIYKKDRMVAFRHHTRPLYGCIYHPEDKTYTQRILRNFIKITKQRRNGHKGKEFP